MSLKQEKIRKKKKGKIEKGQERGKKAVLD